MDLTAGEFEAELVRAAEKAISIHGARDAVRRAHDSETGLIDALWNAAAEQGWFLLAAPEDLGGMGGALYQSAMLMEAAGRALAPGPWIGSIIAAALLGGAAEGQKAREGARIALALDHRGEADPPRNAGNQLSGRCPSVMYAAGADAILVDVEGELWWAENVNAHPVPAKDPGLRLAAVSFEGADVRNLNIATADVLPAIDVLVASQAVGVADGALQLACEYALTREQFGKPIGSFQAIKHRLADAAARVEKARALSAVAAVQLSEGSAAKNVCSSAWHLAASSARATAKDAILIHGAMGFTWECDAHLFLMRAHTLGEFRMSLNDALDAVFSDVDQLK